MWTFLSRMISLSLPCSQELPIGPIPKPDESSQQPHILFFFSLFQVTSLVSVFRYVCPSEALCNTSCYTFLRQGVTSPHQTSWLDDHHLSDVRT